MWYSLASSSTILFLKFLTNTVSKYLLYGAAPIIVPHCVHLHMMNFQLFLRRLLPPEVTGSTISTTSSSSSLSSNRSTTSLLSLLLCFRRLLPLLLVVVRFLFDLVISSSESNNSKHFVTSPVCKCTVNTLNLPMPNASNDRLDDLSSRPRWNNRCCVGDIGPRLGSELIFCLRVVSVLLPSGMENCKNDNNRALTRT